MYHVRYLLIIIGDIMLGAYPVFVHDQSSTTAADGYSKQQQQQQSLRAACLLVLAHCYAYASLISSYGTPDPVSSSRHQSGGYRPSVPDGSNKNVHKSGVYR